MPVRARSTTPAIKDKVANLGFLLSTLSATPGAAGTLFMNPWYDYEIKSISALVRIAVPATTTAAFTVGYGAYTNQHGVLMPAVTNAFLAAAQCLDPNGIAAFGNGPAILQPGTLVFFPIPADNGMGNTVLPAGAPLVVAGAPSTSTGQIVLTVILRPKDWDRGDSSKRPWGASDHAFATYYK
jgi:hypothetical protein